nr:hypothetical protein [Ignavibacteriaceae bacterium]
KTDVVVNDSSKFVDSTENLPWARSLYLSSGFGTPQGLRFELGYNFGSDISLAATFGIKDNWSRDPEEGTLGIIGKIHFYKNKLISGYFLIGTGSTLAIMGEPDTYWLIQVGTKINLTNWLQLCPELGYALTSKHISGGVSLFGKDTPEARENVKRLGFNVSFEIDFRQIF